jgi:type I site-specific restriction endonuclease
MVDDIKSYRRKYYQQNKIKLRTYQKVHNEKIKENSYQKIKTETKENIINKVKENKLITDKQILYIEPIAKHKIEYKKIVINF